MKKLSSILVIILLLSNLVRGQNIKSYNLHFGDTVSVIDDNDLKQGRWVYLGQDKIECWFKDYKPNQIVEEGYYKDNKKTGIWIRYHTNGKIQSELKYINDTIDGLAKK